FNEGDMPSVQFVFQFDGTERGVFIRDFYGRIFENKWHLFSLSTGMFARPFGFEVNLSSSDRESPERGRMSQILMRTERDLGAMISFEPRTGKHKLRKLKMDVGIFNGQGLASPAEYDSYKDKIGRIFLKPYSLSRSFQISGGISYLNGGFYQNTKYVNKMGNGGDKFRFTTDSSASNIGMKAPRIYHGIDVQLKLKTGWGNSEIRGEYWRGTQTSIAELTETPPALLSEASYIRSFDGAFFYFLQSVGNPHHQLGIKYDWYDPNIKLKSDMIGMAGSNTHGGDVKFATLSFGYNHYFHENLKLLLWYEIVRNEKTQLVGMTEDLKDNVLTCRLQFRF
ncbi:MAG TPA: hypothetical protein VM012_09505, partial [Flavitalea sp.]|nr:hypothetical protein [Flavitalea sp.]